jgi:(p)ppGpp synthase/HD superfamily hydrolase
VPETFAREKDQILTQYILHHEVDDAEVGFLTQRLDHALERASELHAGQRRKTGEPYIWHPVRTAMEVSRLGRIIDWASIEASLLHDTLEDTSYTYDAIQNEFADAANLVLALTKIKDNRVHTYQKLFRYVLQDIRVLLVKLADRLDNLESLTVFNREKQVRIARESAEMYANICRRLCMLDLAGRLTEKIGPILTPEAFGAFQQAQLEFKEGWARPIDELKEKLAAVFPGDLAARIDVRWNRFRPGTPLLPENLYTVRIITETSEDAYRALGRVHLAFQALPGTFSDTFSTARKNGYRALETRGTYQGRIVSFYIASQSADRFNRLGLLAMDITSPQFNLEYLDDLREFLQNEDTDIQDFLRFHRPDAIQVTSPKGQVFSLEEGATALDYAFAVHEQLGLRALSARVNDEDAALATVLRPGDRVEIIAADEPVADDRYLSWAHGRRALTSVRRYLRRLESERAAITGRQWLLDVGQAHGIAPGVAQASARHYAAAKGRKLEDLYRGICFGDQDIEDVLGSPGGIGRRRSGSAILRRWRGRDDTRRRVRRYEFEDRHIRFCPACAPVEGDEIEGTPKQGRLLVHRIGCPAAGEGGNVPLTWEKGGERDLRDPGPVELEITLEDGTGVLYSVLGPFKNLGLDIRQLKLPHGDRRLSIEFQPGADRTLNRLIHALRRNGFVEEIRVFRSMP